MSFMKCLVLVCVAANLVACAFVPKVDNQQDYAKHCEMYTKELTLDAVSLGGFDCGGSSSCVVIASLIPVTTFLVSGSIVLVGNTVHWLEYQGSCDESLLQSSFNALIPSVESESLEINREAESMENEGDNSVIKTEILEPFDAISNDSEPLKVSDSIEENNPSDENIQK